MYLTHCPLNPERRSTRELLASPQRLHAAVLSCFPPGTSSNGRILWRLDRPERHRLDLFLTSPIAPSMESLIDQAGWPSQPEWRTADYSRFLRGLAEGQSWVFRLRANPIRNARVDGETRGRRTALRTVAEQEEWLVTRGERHGFALAPGEDGPNLRVLERATERFRKANTTADVTLRTAAFEGVLVVTDATRLAESLTEGIGAGKGYGCGLMTLARNP